MLHHRPTLEGILEIRTIDTFIEYFESVRTRTRRLVLLIPPEQLEWRPHAGMFSPGDIVRHLAGTERYLFVENVLGNISSYPGHGAELADGLDAVIAYFDALHVQSLSLLRGLSDADLQRKCKTVAGTPITTWKWLRAMIEHEAHHRGQLYVLLALLGVQTPPLYGLTEPQVKELSVRSPAT